MSSDDTLLVSGTYRETIKKIAEKIGVSDLEAVHIAINRLYGDVFPEEIAAEFPPKELIDAINEKHDSSRVLSAVTLAETIGLNP